MTNIDELIRSRGGHRAAATKMINDIHDLIDDRYCDVDTLSDMIGNLNDKRSEIQVFDRKIQRRFPARLKRNDIIDCDSRTDDINECLRRARRHLRLVRARNSDRRQQISARGINRRQQIRASCSNRRQQICASGSNQSQICASNLPGLNEYTVIARERIIQRTIPFHSSQTVPVRDLAPSWVLP